MINIFRNTDDIIINNNSNIYLVTGLVGSGKSYLSKKMVKENPNIILFQLDWLKFSKYADEFGKSINDGFIKNNPEVFEYMQNKFANAKPEDRNGIYKSYINKYFDYFLTQVDKDKKYIVEGNQIFSCLNQDKLIGKEYNIYIKGTSCLNSLTNRIKRDYDEEEKLNIKTKIKFFIRVLKESRLFYIKHRKKLNDFIRKLNAYL
ncbi:MAG TPA: hypothetical protein PKY25_01545 [Bacilli bacterium]|nr:hypothetical protein [Bacilli bacterium]